MVSDYLVSHISPHSLTSHFLTPSLTTPHCLPPPYAVAFLFLSSFPYTTLPAFCYQQPPYLTMPTCACLLPFYYRHALPPSLLLPICFFLLSFGLLSGLHTPFPSLGAGLGDLVLAGGRHALTHLPSCLPTYFLLCLLTCHHCLPHYLPAACPHPTTSSACHGKTPFA